MNLRQVEAFRAVMLAGTTTQAANLLRSSQPAVSRLIHQLESAMQIRLFRRAKGRLQPTPEAHQFYAEVERSFVGLDKLRQTGASLRAVGTGHLRIAALPVVGLGLVPHALRHFLAAYPGATVALHVRASKAVKDLVASGQYDLGLAADEIDTAGVDWELFSRTRGVCVMPVGHRLSEKAVVRPADLENEAFVSLDVDDLARARIDKVFEQARVRRRLIIESQYAATICSLARAGAGIGIVNPFAIGDVVSADFVARPFAPAVEFKTLLLTPPARPPSRLAEGFITILKKVRDGWLRRDTHASGRTAYGSSRRVRGEDGVVSRS